MITTFSPFFLPDVLYLLFLNLHRTILTFFFLFIFNNNYPVHIDSFLVAPGSLTILQIEWHTFIRQDLRYGHKQVIFLLTFLIYSNVYCLPLCLFLFLKLASKLEHTYRWKSRCIYLRNWNWWYFGRGWNVPKTTKS